MSKSLDPSEAQEWRHNMRNLAEFGKIIDDELARVEFPEGFRREAVLMWWKNIFSDSTAPDFAGILKGLFPPQEEE